MDTSEETFQPIVAAITIFGSGQLGPTVAAVIGLIGTTIGGLALARADDRTRTSRSSSSATVALVLGVVSVAFGGLFLATADGGPGTGNGVVGSIVAMVLGPIAVVLGGLAWSRSRSGGRQSRDQIPPAAAAPH